MVFAILDACAIWDNSKMIFHTFLNNFIKTDGFAGIRIRKRTCDSPSPKKGGVECPGCDFQVSLPWERVFSVGSSWIENCFMYGRETDLYFRSRSVTLTNAPRREGTPDGLLGWPWTPVYKMVTRFTWRSASDSVAARRRMIHQAYECSSPRKRNVLVGTMGLVWEGRMRMRNLSTRVAGANGPLGACAIVLAERVPSIGWVSFWHHYLDTILFKIKSSYFMKHFENGIFFFNILFMSK